MGDDRYLALNASGRIGGVPSADYDADWGFEASLAEMQPAGHHGLAGRRSGAAAPGPPGGFAVAQSLERLRRLCR